MLNKKNHEICTLCQHDFTIVIVHELLVHGHCSESCLHSLLSRSSRLSMVSIIALLHEILICQVADNQNVKQPC